MSAPKFTPGPWGIWNPTALKKDGPIDIGGATYTATVSHLEDRAERNANAHLIATAPELYEALEKLASYPLEDFGKESKADSQPLFGANSWQLNVGHVKAARRALAKARGES